MPPHEEQKIAVAQGACELNDAQDQGLDPNPI